MRQKSGRYDWLPLRSAICRAVLDKKIRKEDFRPLSLHENHKVTEEKIYHTFCQLEHPTLRPNWIWQNFKRDYSVIPDLKDRPERYLHHLINHDETVWYIVNEDGRFWFYEGRIRAIQTIIDETWFDEVYIVSKKYKWLVCINHHDALIVTGELGIPDRKTMEHL